MPGTAANTARMPRRFRSSFAAELSCPEGVDSQRVIFDKDARRVLLWDFRKIRGRMPFTLPIETSLRHSRTAFDLCTLRAHLM